MKGNKNIKESLIEELSKQDNEKTTIQIRLFDDKTGSVTYKHLTRKELYTILEALGDIEWL